MLKVLSIQIADTIDIKQFKVVFKAELLYEDSDELFYRVKSHHQKLVYIFKYGIVCFLSYDEVEIISFIQAIMPYCRNPLEQQLSDEFDVEVDAHRNKFGYNKIEIEHAGTESLRLIMLHVSQSVALDHFSQQTNLLLEETTHHTQQLERKGRLDLSGTALKKFIGRTLNLKNRIEAHLYIFDSPEETWEDENLNRLDIGLKKTFDLQARFKTIREGLEIVKENLDLFKDLLQYRNSIVLEWIIIILILVEVINLFVEKLLQ
jgi:required for meiotic nuclear division protein 1